MPKLLVAIIAAASAALALTDQAQPPSAAHRAGGGVSAPQLLSKVEPQYSEEARKAHIQGAVVLYIEVNPDGSAQNIRVVRALGSGLDEKAIQAVRQWKFKPGKKDGSPVTVAATIEVNFRLLETVTQFVGDMESSGVRTPVMLTFDFNGQAGTIMIGLPAKPASIENVNFHDPELTFQVRDNSNHSVQFHLAATGPTLLTSL